MFALLPVFYYVSPYVSLLSDISRSTERVVQQRLAGKRPVEGVLG